MEKYCRRCETTKDESQFHRRSMSSDGLDTYCKQCRNSEVKAPTTLLTAEPFVREGAEEILTALGYELYNDDNPIHKQFDERMATKYGNK